MGEYHLLMIVENSKAIWYWSNQEKCLRWKLSGVVQGNARLPIIVTWLSYPLDVSAGFEKTSWLSYVVGDWYAVVRFSIAMLSCTALGVEREHYSRQLNTRYLRWYSCAVQVICGASGAINCHYWDFVSRAVSLSITRKWILRSGFLYL